MIISIRVSEIDGVLLKKYSEYYHESVSGFMRRLALEQIEKDFNYICHTDGENKTFGDDRFLKLPIAENSDNNRL